MGKKALKGKAVREKTFKTYRLGGGFEEHLPEIPFDMTMIIYGMSGQGKTTYALKLCKELSKHGKVWFNSLEMRHSFALQRALERTDISDEPIFFEDNASYEEMFKKLKTNRARFVVIDSLDYMKLTHQDYKKLKETYRKSFIIIAHAKNPDTPKSAHAKNIEFDVDLKVSVHNGVATVANRYGESKPFVIFQKQGRQKSLF